MKKKLYLVDISSFIFRAYYAIRPLHTKAGVPVNAVFGVISMINKLMETQQPDHLIVCYDRPEKGFRHDVYPEYKANRSAPPEDLVPQFGLINEFVQTYPFNAVSKAGYEADDLIATMVHKYKAEPEIEIYIVSSDKDLMQLLDKNVFLYDTMKDKVFLPEDVMGKFGVLPDKVIDVQSLCGDPTDNIPGIPGVGPKTASKLIAEYGSLENVLKNAQDIKGKLGEKIIEGKDKALLSRKLVSLVTDVDIDLNWETLEVPEKNGEALNLFYQKLDFTKFISTSFSSNTLVTATEKLEQAAFITVTSLEQLQSIVLDILKTQPEYLAIDTETDSLDALQSELVGLSFCYSSQQAFYVPLAHHQGPNLETQAVLKILEPVFTATTLAKAGQNIKFDLNVLSQKGVQIFPVVHDTLVASYLIDPSGQHNLDFLAKKYLNHENIKFRDLVPKGKTFADVDLAIATQYAAEDAWVTYCLIGCLKPQLQESGLEKIYTQIEMPLVPILASMEQAGIDINEPFLEELKTEFTTRLQTLETSIYELAGEEFNINSPKQLSVILFEKLHLPALKKTKTGYSTDVDVLTDLAREHELPQALLLYRTLSKLLSTYVEQLKNLIHPKTHRIHTHFNQTIVATGRLSSTEPNLQNIPIKTEEGKRIRQAFVAPENSWLLSADYSQIELRLLAAFSQDPNLQDAYEKDQDIHARTAAHIFGVPIETVESAQRSIGKTINFGVIYGQSPFGLSKQLGIPQKEARKFIDGFYAEFSQVKIYKEDVLLKAKEDGFVTTFMGRKRYLPDMNSQNHLARQNAERMAFNTVFQGSAADLIKIAMIEIQKRIIKDGMKTKMILQVHDELVFEVPEEELSVARKFIPHMMETAFDLCIPLRVTSHIGKSWAEAH